MAVGVGRTGERPPPGTTADQPAPPAGATGGGGERPAAPGPAAPQARTVPPGSALALLAGLSVKGRGPRTGYDRSAFGPAWADTDRNGCDTRNDVLRRDLREVVLRPGTRGCVVLAGRLPDPYTDTDTEIVFVRGDGSVEIDHVVSLNDAWQKGAAQWAPGKRLALANDPLDLLAVQTTANRAKSDGDAATWLPPARSYRCAFVARQVAVKAKYGLSVMPAERDAIARVLQRCPEQRPPVGAAPTEVPVASRPTSPLVDPPDPDAGTRVDSRYPYCKDLPPRLGPYRRDVDPEYAWYRDPDADGVVCE